MRVAILIGFILCLPAAQAGVVLFTLSGTFGPSAQTSPYYAAGTAFTLSFELDNPPILTGASLTLFSTAAFDVDYASNGSPIPLTGAFAEFVQQNNWIFCLDALCDAEIITGGTAPTFTGALFTPTLVPGDYAQTQVFSRTNFVGDSGST